MFKKILIPAAVTLPVVALLYYGMQRDVRTIESPLPGRMAFDFTAPTLAGDTLSLSDLEGQVVVLNFWASWCIACIDEHRVFIEADRYYADQDFQMLGVVYQDSPENARRWMRQRGGEWPSVIDPNSRIAIDYGVYGVPETYFISKDGYIAYKHIGPVTPQVMVKWVDRLLAEDRGAELTATDGDVPEGRSQGHVRQAPDVPVTTPESGGGRP
ncbi:MAG: TlpA family protein disulfide reductase [Gemmatimonadetes bacterium]|uniref:TlpA family protein disulfide reductase n=1 Tax=Candidatus Kutchimonas denitrificans TaxID=3056748 RepID=A0AAE5CBA5_9BACT|nr:TlpA family protein disulfide reductase [Gemmatimonadota bacterium]NIR74190.1 TlpA family protein disulfide reductase [Candidatus Kutchimonas denitrificans]NIR99812.1 TlpA family protein disulfide reductase [Gemmatimonadota bacterium]NIT65401.1 TlpA family protein disulfide reductase [Gemmatimonadota bacterium]NIU51767.1 redoxin domain-containing protein [Gemmatimonadota bacterium]